MLSVQQMLLGNGIHPAVGSLWGRRIIEVDTATYSGVGSWMDLSGYNHEAPIYFNNIFSGSTPYQYAQFGSGRYVTFNSADDVAKLKHFSVALWINLDSLPPGGDNPIVSGGSTWSLRMDGSTSLNLVKYGQTDQTVYFNTPFQTGQWYHIVAAVDETETRYYVNGIKVGVYGNSSTVSDSYGSFRIHPGIALKLRKAQVYDYPLSDVAVVGLFNSECADFSVTALPLPSSELDPQNTQAYLDPYQMGTLGDLVDQSPNGNNMVLSNGGSSIIYNDRWRGVVEANGTSSYDGFKLSQNWEYQSAMTVMVASRYISSTYPGRILAADNNWLIGQWMDSVERCYLGDNIGWVSDNSSSPSGHNEDWKIYTATINNSGSEYKFYINGALNNTRWGSNNGGPRNMQIFSCGAYAGEHSNGQAGVVIVWNYILSESEVARAYEYFRCRYGI